MTDWRDAIRPVHERYVAAHDQLWSVIVESNAHEDSIVTWLVGLAAGGSALVLANFTQARGALLPWALTILLGFFTRLALSALNTRQRTLLHRRLIQIALLLDRTDLINPAEYDREFQRIRASMEADPRSQVFQAIGTTFMWLTFTSFIAGLVCVAYVALRAPLAVQ